MRLLRALSDRLLHTRLLCMEALKDEENWAARSGFAMKEMVLYWFLICQPLLGDAVAVEDWCDASEMFRNASRPVVHRAVAELHGMLCAKHAEKLLALHEEAGEIFEKDGDDWILKPGAGRFDVQDSEAHDADLWHPPAWFMQDNPPSHPAGSGDAIGPPPGLPAPRTPPKRPRSSHETSEPRWTEKELGDIWNTPKVKEMAGIVRQQLHEDFDLPRWMDKNRIQQTVWYVGGRSLWFYPGSGFPWNEHKDQPLRHSYRTTGSTRPVIIQGSVWGSIDQWKAHLPVKHAPCGLKRGVSEGFRRLVSWLWNRPHIWDKLQGIELIQRNHWLELGFEVNSWLETPEVGVWWKLHFDFTRAHRDVAWDKRVLGYHGSAMYVVGRVVAEQNLRSGWAENTEGKSTVRGIFYMNPAQAHCCANYMLYSMLDDQDGWLFAPLFELSVDRDGFVAKGRKATLHRSQDQRVCDEDTCRLNAVFIHQAHLVEMLAAPKASSWQVEAGWVHELEIDPTLSWEEVRRISKESAHSGAEPTS